MDEESSSGGGASNGTTGGAGGDAAGEPPPAVPVAPTEGEGSATPREEAALRRARTVSRLLDEAVRVPGTGFRVGLDPVLGVLPGAGDAVAAAASLYPVAEAVRLGAPKRSIAKMLALVAVDAAVGSVPVVGPVFDAVWKANEWNVGTLERHVRRA